MVHSPEGSSLEASESVWPDRGCQLTNNCELFLLRVLIPYQAGDPEAIAKRSVDPCDESLDPSLSLLGVQTALEE